MPSNPLPLESIEIYKRTNATLDQLAIELNVDKKRIVDEAIRYYLTAKNKYSEGFDPAFYNATTRVVIGVALFPFNIP